MFTGLEKLVRLQITTPFPHFQTLRTGAYFKFVTYPDQWENKMDFEIYRTSALIFRIWANSNSLSATQSRPSILCVASEILCQSNWKYGNIPEQKIYS
jgi:hypothetical protein